MNIQYRKFDNGLEFTMIIGDFKLIKVNNGTKAKSIIMAENRQAVKDAKDPEISSESSKDEFKKVFLEVQNYIQNELNQTSKE